MGRKVRCVAGRELVKNSVLDDHIIQEGIIDIKLLDGKKFVLRPYVIVYNKRVFMAKDVLCIIHGSVYDSTSTSHAVQIGHYAPGVDMVPLADTAYAAYGARVRDAVAAVRRVFDGAVEASSEHRYALIGPDLLLRENGSLVFIEFNDFPSMACAGNARKCALKQRVVTGLYKLAFLDEIDHDILWEL